MKKDFLLEILVQELPYKFIPSAIKQLKSAFEKLFKEQELDYKEIKVYATPRRLAVLVFELDVEQKTITKDIKGPILNIAKDENGYTKAALGFASKNSANTEDLYEKDNYIWAKIEIKGKKTSQILAQNVESIILNLQGAHFMRWGYNSEKFSRPIENVMALLGNEAVDLKVLDKKANNQTKGHRYSKIKTLVIDEPKNYLNLLKTAQVIANQEERRELIIKNAQDCAHKNNLEIKFEDMEDLLEEVTYITEYPISVLCDFDKKYLQIPSIVTTTVMTQHQRYFPLWDKEGRLSNHFITMANYVGDDFSNIKAGNQRVICARLEDGVFFYKEDTKTKLETKLENLKGMTFQKGLGSLFDKTQRMIELSKIISQKLNIKDNDDILRCAKLAKCDLATKLVFEFTELQGFIGENYALLDGEKQEVAKGICEHYFPLGANSELACDITGQIVSIADKIDTICALFISTQKDKKKKRPTGSNDPLGARRAAIGVLRTIIEKNLKLNLKEIIENSLKMLSDEFSTALEDTILDELNEFFIARLVFMYEKEFNTNVIQSCSNQEPLRDLGGFIKRLNVINKIQKDASFDKLKENAKRVLRILKNQQISSIDDSLFVLNEEKNLYSAILNQNEDSSDIEKYILSLEQLNQPIEEFFEKVLVMDKDEKIKTNRLALLNMLKEKFEKVCDFEKL